MSRDEDAALAVGGAAVSASFTPDEEVQVKRVIVALGLETGSLVEWTLILAKQGSLSVGMRDEPERVVKTGYVNAGDRQVYVDFVTTIRMQRGDVLGIVVENIAGATTDVHTSLLTLFREM